MSDEEVQEVWEFIVGVEDQNDQLNLNVIYDLLSNSRRRYVIEYLDQHDGSVPLDDLSIRLAAEENDIDAEDVTEDQRKRLYVALYQRHLAMLGEAGLIEFDDQTKNVIPQNRDLIEELALEIRGLSLDDSEDINNLFYVLKNSRRRYVLHFLKENGGSVELGELSRHLAGEEEGIEPDDVSPRQEKRVFISLYQTHLDKLEKLGLVEWDQKSKEVKLPQST